MTPFERARPELPKNVVVFERVFRIIVLPMSKRGDYGQITTMKRSDMQGGNREPFEFHKMCSCYWIDLIYKTQHAHWPLMHQTMQQSNPLNGTQLNRELNGEFLLTC